MLLASVVAAAALVAAPARAGVTYLGVATLGFVDKSGLNGTLDDGVTPANLLGTMRSLHPESPEDPLEGDDYARVLCTATNVFAGELMQLPRVGTPEEQAEARGRLVRVFEEPQAFGYAVHAVWPHARAMPLKTRVLIDLLAERLVSALAVR